MAKTLNGIFPKIFAKLEKILNKIVWLPSRMVLQKNWTKIKRYLHKTNILYFIPTKRTIILLNRHYGCQKVCGIERFTDCRHRSIAYRRVRYEFVSVDVTRYNILMVYKGKRKHYRHPSTREISYASEVLKAKSVRMGKAKVEG